MRFSVAVKRVLRNIGYDLIPFDCKSSPVARRLRLLESYSVDLVLDVGANIGQYAIKLREQGYRGRIVSFEPLSAAFRRLSERARHDPLWTAVNMALGAENQMQTIHIARNSESSSFLEMLPRHTRVAPDSVYIDREQVGVCTLDSVFSQYRQESKGIFLKIDAQGYERAILQGARKCMKEIIGIQVEMSLVALYAGAPSFAQMYDLICGMGYTLMSIESGFTDPSTGQMLQVDGIFFRTEDQGAENTHHAGGHP